MKRFRTALVFVLLVAIQIAVAQGDAIGAETRGEEDADGVEAASEQRRSKMGGETGKRIAGAQESLADQRYDEARAILAWLDIDRLNPYERSRVEQLLAGIDQAEGNLAGARSHLEAALSSQGLSTSEESTVRYQIAQLLMAEEKWQDGANALEEWLRTAVDPKPAGYYLLGIAYYQLERYDVALEPAERAVNLSESPQENWLQLLLALRIQREEFDAARPVLEKLVEGFPEKKSYWIQLSSVNAAVGRYEDAAAVMQLAHTAGLLTEDQDLRRLSELLAHVGIPFRGGNVLASAMTEREKLRSDQRAQELLGNCWIAAREYPKALEPLAEASALAESGDLYVRLAQVYVQLENWPKAGDALESAIDKGKLANQASAELLLGIAYYSEKRPDKARPWFERASTDEQYRAQAEGWLKQLDVATQS
jgi:tetratricopeptide (TPR) repeat protein